jgi:hypothetical protein
MWQNICHADKMYFHAGYRLKDGYAEMSDTSKKGLKISEMIARDELRPLEGMLSEYQREMEKMRIALEKAGAATKKPSKKPAKKPQK